MGTFRKIRVRLYETQALKKTIVRMFAESRGFRGSSRGRVLYSQQIDRGRSRSRGGGAAVREVAGEWGRSERCGCVYRRLKLLRKQLWDMISMIADVR